MSGCSSGVEHNLAKVGVERSNRFTRSILLKKLITPRLDNRPSADVYCFSIIEEN